VANRNGRTLGLRRVERALRKPGDAVAQANAEPPPQRWDPAAQVKRVTGA